MFCADVLRRRGLPGAEATEAAAFDALRRHILGAARSEPVRPACAALADQLVWARAPARVDLAGGWTDTPPYCIEHGGRVTNAAVELNGQPPIHVFARPAPHREIVVRSVDLGIEERIRTYEDLDAYARPGSGFALARAALALAGFLPRFHRDGGFPSLAAQLDDFGAGIELSLVAAVPAGSGLGASSILAATLLAALSDLCALGWDTRAVMGRTLAVEQMVTTGGGWQDQAGGALRGLKLLETARGPAQDLTVRWLPEHLFEEGCARGTILLYYTGVTRMAKGILQEIVRGMFLNAGDRLAILKEIGENASFAADVLQRGDWEGLCEAVRRSWDLNRRLDAETDPPAVQAIVEPIRDRLAAYKLLGAGGGGYLLLLAKDEAAGRSIRAELAQAPARPTARIVQAGLSMSGLHVTRS
jgi:galactokinase/mevalonate kinase-like predicted kinase